MRNVAFRWRRPAVARQSEVVATENAPAGRAKSAAPAPRASLVVDGGRSTVTQCQNPPGVAPYQCRRLVIADVLAVTYVVALDGERVDLRQELVRVRGGESFQGPVTSS
jgi:hypothetical protein